jgi:hypothetical protein
VARKFPNSKVARQVYPIKDYIARLALLYPYKTWHLTELAADKNRDDNAPRAYTDRLRYSFRFAHTRCRKLRDTVRTRTKNAKAPHEIVSMCYSGFNASFAISALRTNLLQQVMIQTA